MKGGRFALVGAGPGDPGLLTLRAAELLRAADVVAHDQSIPEAILAMVPARAELFVLGPASGLHPELKARAILGQVVVQLELGGSLRSNGGGAEAEGLTAAGVAFEIVPGVSAEARGVTSGALVGRTIIVARARPGLSEVGRQLRDLGATAIELPHVEKGTTTRIALTASELRGRDVALLSSAEAVEAWLDTGLELPVLALGNDVTALLRAANRPPVHTLRGACLEALGEARQYLSGRRVLVPIAAGSRTTLIEPLGTLGATPLIVPIAGQQSFAPGRWPVQVDRVVLPSSLAALALYSEAPPEILHVPAIAIGPQSAAQATRSGATDVRMTAHDTIESLVAGAVESFTPTSLMTAVGAAS